MKNDPIAFSRTLESAVCTFEKLRICIKLAFRIPNERPKISSSKRFLRNSLSAFLDQDYLFEISNFAGLGRAMLMQCLNSLGIDPDENLADGKVDRVLLVCHELSRTGAPKAALMAAKAIQAGSETRVVVVSEKDGPMRDEFEDAGMSVMLMEDLPITRSAFVLFSRHFRCVFVNSVAWDFLRIVPCVRIPVVWWVHEIFTSDFEYKRISEFLPSLSLVLGGSPLVGPNLRERLEIKHYDTLLYGLEPLPVPVPKQRDRITFALLGTVDRRKGADIFINAIRALPPKVRGKAAFVMVGDASTEEYRLLVERAVVEVEELQHVPSMPFPALVEAYGGFDCIVSASRADPMPIVVSYGFMFSKLCLCSTATGSSILMEDGEDGVVFAADSDSALGVAICRAVLDWEAHRRMGERGAQLFSRHFSMEAFTQTLREKLDCLTLRNVD